MVPVVAFECRGCEPVGWHPQTSCRVKTTGGKVFEDVDLEEKEWCEFGASVPPAPHRTAPHRTLLAPVRSESPDVELTTRFPCDVQMMRTTSASRLWSSDTTSSSPNEEPVEYVYVCGDRQSVCVVNPSCTRTAAVIYDIGNTTLLLPVPHRGFEMIIRAPNRQTDPYLFLHFSPSLIVPHHTPTPPPLFLHRGSTRG